MDDLTRKYAIKALDYRLKRLDKFIKWQSNIYETHSKALDRKSGTQAGILEVEFDETTSANLVREASSKLERARKNYEGYSAAREALANV